MGEEGLNYPARMGDIQICSIILNWTDRIRLLGVPMHLTNALREAILEGWGQPIQKEKLHHGTHEFKLKGCPWNGMGAEAVSSRRLVASVLMCMARHGWNLIQAADVSKKEGDKDTLFFEYGVADPEVLIFPVTFNMGDRIRVIDAPNMFPYVKEAVKTQWPQNIQAEREYHGSIELKLQGNPWYATGSESVHCRMVLNQVLANCRAAGYKLYGSIDVSIGGEGRDLESWFFRKVGPAWQ